MRKIFKNSNKTIKLDSFIKKHNIPREYLSINRKSITRGLWIGIFWAFIPMPMQMIAVLLCTPFFKFNVPIALAMVWISNPITMPIIYYVEYMTGNYLLGLDSLHVELTAEWFSTHIDDILIPLYVGTFVYAIGVSTIVFYVVNWLWVKSVRKEKRHQKRKDNKSKKVTKQ